MRNMLRENYVQRIYDLDMQETRMWKKIRASFL